MGEIGAWTSSSDRSPPTTGTQAQRALVDLFFRHTAVNRVEAGTDLENVAEQSAAELECGGRRERVRSPS